MKKKLLSMFLLLTLLFTSACNKEKTADPTPTATPTATEAPTATPTPTPTPVPENKALAALQSLSDSVEYLLEYTPEETVDYSNGIGMDMTMDLTINSEIMGLFGLTGIDTIGMNGSFDIKDTLAGNFDFSLGETELLNFQMLTDMNQFFFNLPKYSDQYAGFSLEELLDSTGETLEWEEVESPSASGLLSDDAYQVIRTNTTIDSASLTTGEDMVELISTYLKRFIDCFQPQEGSEEAVSIGTGDYTMTGEKHTVSASATDLQAVIDAMAADPLTPAELATELDTIVFENFNSFVMNYYVDENGSFAWEIYPDTQASKPVVFISVPAGFCLYSSDNGTDDIAFYSVTTGEGSGTLTVPAAAEGESDISVEYHMKDENNISVHMLADTMELTMEVSKTGDSLKYDYTVVVDGISIVMEATVVSQKEADLSLSIASYGMLIATLDVQADFRDYTEIPMPQESVDLDTWTANLDMETFSADLEQLMTDYPALADLFLGSGEEEDYVLPEDEEPFILDENYSDEFMNMTGYNIDENGFVFFIPLEEEVLAIGKPSTGYDRYPVSDEVRQKLLNLGAKTFPTMTPEVYTNYTISGFVEDNNVCSHYMEEHIYLLNENYDAYCGIAFDAISHELLQISIFHKTPEEALSFINEALAILGLEAATLEDLNNYASRGDLYLYGFEDDLCYGASIMVTPEE
ncbi:MAG: hypothetical protein J6J42_13105 [Lachnospiraceae bacterium]|nr:hypothetical protein [Lachnospiraceae bacterium]